MADRPMILPSDEDLADGKLWMGDHRVPVAFAFDDHARRVGRSYTDPEHRHLYDAIMASREVYDNEGDVEREQFRLHLTCVQCGHIERLEGDLRLEGRPGPTGLDPKPIAAGGLHAQQVSLLGGWGGEDYSKWSVYDGERWVGQIGWASGPRGRRFYVGRLDAWPDEVRGVQGATPLAVLRKLAKATPAGPVS